MMGNGYQGYPGMSSGMGFSQFTAGMNWVNSKAEADNMELPPGGSAVLFDKVNDGVLYIRTRDSYNVYNTRVFEYKEVQPAQPASPYVTRTELEEMFSKYLGGVQNDTIRADAPTSTATAGNYTDKSAGSGKRKENG